MDKRLSEIFLDGCDLHSASIAFYGISEGSWRLTSCEETNQDVSC